MPDLASLFNPSQLYDALNERGLLPQWAQTRPYTSATGEYYPSTNRMIAQPLEPGNDARTNTVAHELSHAVQDNLLKSMQSYIAEKAWNLKNDEQLTDQEKQYWRAANQIYNTQAGRVGQYDRRAADANLASKENLMKRLYTPDPDPKMKPYDDYRTSMVEAQGFGVGNMSTPRPHAFEINPQVNPHLDPTMATEFSILLNMYKQLPEALKQQAAMVRNSEIQRGRDKDIPIQQQGMGFEDRLKPDFKDPFVEAMKNQILSGGTRKPYIKRK